MQQQTALTRTTKALEGIDEKIVPLREQIEETGKLMADEIAKASESSSRLATALNRITICGVIVAIATLGWQIVKTFVLEG